MGERIRFILSSNLWQMKVSMLVAEFGPGGGVNLWKRPNHIGRTFTTEQSPSLAVIAETIGSNNAIRVLRLFQNVGDKT